MRIRELLIVEGKYDAAKLSGLVDGMILPLNGFSIYRDAERRALIREMGAKRGIIILTDSDAAGFQLRHYVEGIAAGASIKNAYIPAVPGKERRKPHPSREGTLGVEGMPAQLLLEALRRAGATEEQPRQGRQISYADLYRLGLSGTAGSAGRRRQLLATIGLPLRLSKKALLEVLNTSYTYEELQAVCAEKPVLLWDFHGTLTLPADDWLDALRELLPPTAPFGQIAERVHHACLPWWTMPGQPTPAGADWWRYVNGEYDRLLAGCGCTPPQRAAVRRGLRPMLCDPRRHRLYPDALQVLAQLQRRGYRNYLVSNNFPELWQVAQALGLAPYFSGHVVSGELGWDKPARQIFEAALQQAESPRGAVMIGDSVRDDIEGAKALGLGAILVHGREEAPAADACCGSLTDLLALLP